MTTRSKLIVASMVVVAIAGLIVLDLALFQKGRKVEEDRGDREVRLIQNVDPKQTTGADTTKTDTTKEGPKVDVTKDLPKDDASKLDKSRQDDPFKKDKSELVQEQPKETAEVYEVQEGDSFWTIAKKKYGKGSMMSEILKANPDLNPNTLRIGMKIKLPPKAEKIVNPKTPTDSRSETIGNEYVVQVNDKLWNIASKITGGKGINEFIDKIVKANPDKLKSASTTLQPGWRLNIPN